MRLNKIAVALIGVSLVAVAYFAWPRDPFAVLRQFNPEEGFSGPTPTHYLHFEVPADEVRAVLGLQKDQVGYFKLPNGETACFQDFSSPLGSYTCSVWKATDAKNLEGWPLVAPANEAPPLEEALN